MAEQKDSIGLIVREEILKPHPFLESRFFRIIIDSKSNMRQDDMFIPSEHVREIPTRGKSIGFVSLAIDKKHKIIEFQNFYPLEHEQLRRKGISSEINDQIVERVKKIFPEYGIRHRSETALSHERKAHLESMGVNPNETIPIEEYPTGEIRKKNQEAHRKRKLARRKPR